MPIYAYRCAACGHTQDVLQKLSDAPLEVCPACGASTYSKQLSAPGFQLKGSGWYATDFRNAGAAKTADATAKEAGSAEAASAAGAPPKPASDSDAGTKPSAPASDAKPSAAPPAAGGSAGA